MKIIILEDDKEFNQRIVKISNKIVDKRSLEIGIVSMFKYSTKLKDIIFDGDVKIYILDIELDGSKSGYDITRMIREEAQDYKSIIIVSSVHDFRSEFTKKSLSILVYLSKFDDFNSNLEKNLNLALDITSTKKSFKFNDGIIIIDDINYIEKVKSSKYSIIKTSYKVIKVRKTISELEELTEFELIKKNLLVNKKNTISINNNEIIFKDKSKLIIK